MDADYLTAAREAAILTDPTLSDLPDADEKTALYRHFDGEGALLYVGISVCAFTRTSQHRRLSPWFEQVARIDVQWFDTRADAEAAEWKAVRNERPIHNQTFNRKTDPMQSREMAKGPFLVIGDTFVPVSRLSSLRRQAR